MLGAAASEVIAMDSRNIKVLPPETLQKDGVWGILNKKLIYVSYSHKC